MVTYFTISEIAKQLAVGDDIIRTAIANGKLRCVRLGHRTVRITQDAVDSYILNQSDCTDENVPPLPRKRKGKKHV